MEESEKQARSIEGAKSEVNSVTVKANHKGNASAGGSGNVRCFCCGNVGHKANDQRYPARGKQCRKCNGTLCKTKQKQNTGRGTGSPADHIGDGEVVHATMQGK